jgi:hypothetical protein
LGQDEVIVFREALPKYKEWSETAHEIKPDAFTKEIPVGRIVGRNWANFKWGQTSDGEWTAYMVLFQEYRDTTTYGNGKVYKDGRPSYLLELTAKQVELLTEALSMAPRAFDYLAKETKDAREMRDADERVIDQNFN